MNVKNLFPILLISTILLSGCNKVNHNQSHLSPYKENPRYWEYKGNPLLLLGASNNDNLFQSSDMKAQIIKMKTVGGNFIRNSMSFRDSGDVVPFGITTDSLFDLNQWNPEYWQRFHDLLEFCNQEEVIIQIEVWDRFDYSRSTWFKNPYNPANNINYTFEETFFSSKYPDPPELDHQPFFHSIPGMPMYHEGLDIVRRWQENFVDKLLSYCLEYDNILYCMNNETTSPAEWGKYWMEFIITKASAKGKGVYVTDMFDNFFEPEECKPCRYSLEHPEFYLYVEVSQLNSRSSGQEHWDEMQWSLNLRDEHGIRPANCTKVYGAIKDGMWWGFGNSKDGIERFYRDVIGGISVVRHHRPPYGHGLGANALASINAVRKIEKYVNFWDITPSMELLKNREENEAYCSSMEGEKYLIYFPGEGSVLLNLPEHVYSTRWMNCESGEWLEKVVTIEGNRDTEINTPGKEGWIAVITKVD